MPIKKDDAFSFRDGRIRDSLKTLYTNIDQALSYKGHFNGNVEEIFGDEKDEYTDKFNLLKKDYEAAGLKVTRHHGSDQRDSTNWDYITIS